MKPAVYISVNYRSAFERALLGSPHFLCNILNHAQEIVGKTTGYDLDAFLCPMSYPENALPGVSRIPLMKKGHRRFFEFESIANHSSSQNAEWTVIMRPLSGWIQEPRFAHFIEHLSHTRHDSIFSTVAISSFGHPFWNCKVTSVQYEHESCAVLPCTAERGVSEIADTAFGSPDIQKFMTYRRSQDINTIYYEDTALFAIRTKLFNDLDKAIATKRESVKFKTSNNDSPWYFKLLIPEMFDQGTIDLTNIEFSMKG